MRLLRKFVFFGALLCVAAALVLYVLAVTLVCVAAALIASLILLLMLPDERKRRGIEPGDDRYSASPIARYPPTDPGAAGAAMVVRERRTEKESREERPLLIAR